MKKTAILLLLLFVNTLSAQRVAGLILDYTTKEPIKNAHIFINNKVLVTNKKGNFYFNFKKGKQIIFSVSHLKYNDQKITFNTDNSALTIFLYQKQESLSEIKIFSKKNRKYKINFTQLPKLPKATHSFATVLKNNKLFVMGGDASTTRDQLRRGISDLLGSSEQEIMKVISRPKIQDHHSYLGDLQVFDFDLNNWTRKKSVFREKANHNVISYGDKFYLIGGKRLSRKKKRDYLEDKIEIYNTVDKSIEIDGTNPHQAVNFEALLYKHQIFLIGGSTKKSNQGKKEYSNEIHQYDLKSGYWYLYAKMTKGKETQGIILNDTLYLFGGYRKKDLKEIEALSLKTGVWKKIGNLFKGMKKPAITVHKEIIYLFENKQIVTYNTKFNELKSYAIDLNLLGSRMHFFKNKLYIVGGYLNSEFDKVPNSGFYSISLKEFKTTRPLKAKLF